MMMDRCAWDGLADSDEFGYGGLMDCAAEGRVGGVRRLGQLRLRFHREVRLDG